MWAATEADLRLGVRRRTGGLLRGLPKRHRARGVALYLTVVALSVLVAATSLTLVASQRAERELQNNITLDTQLHWSALATVNLARAAIEQMPTWRTYCTNLTGADFTITLDGVQCTAQLYDDKDGDLQNNEADPVRLVATATQSGAIHIQQVILQPRPHPALAYAAFTGNNVSFKGNTIIKGPTHADQALYSQSGVTTQEGASFETLTAGSIDWRLTPQFFTSTTVALPNPDLSVYRGMATAVTGAYGTKCELRGYNLTPTYNPTGSANANGIYSVDARRLEVYIENIHVNGTLIIYNTNGHKVGLTNGLWFEPGPLNYPVLLVDSSSNYLDIYPDQSSLVESSTYYKIGLPSGTLLTGTGVDFNRDGDTSDSFSTAINGLVWSNANKVYMRNGTWSFAGCVITPTALETNDHLTLDEDPRLQNMLMPGFLGSGMQVVRGSCHEVR